MAKKEIIESKGKLNEIIWIEERRPNGTLRRIRDFSHCVSLTDQSQINANDVNYLVKKHTVAELDILLSARAAQRKEIVGHDFSQEPDLQTAKNEVLRLKKAFEDLPEQIKNEFKNVSTFLKFIDNPQNQETMLKLGLLTKKQIQTITTTPEQTPTPKPAEKEK